MIEHLKYLYPSEEFSKKFLSYADDEVVNTYIDDRGDLIAVYIDHSMHLYSKIVDWALIIKDLQKDHQDMRELGYDYNLAFSYVELHTLEDNMVFIRVEKRKEVINNG